MSNQSPSIIHVVHCIDTEGPLHESITATFDRLQALIGVEVAPTSENLKRIQRQEMDLGGGEALAAKVFAPGLLSYHSTWDDIDGMLAEMMSLSFRNARPDSFGGGWVYNWHCLDHIGFVNNPRRRDIGFHNVFDRRVNAPLLRVKKIIHVHDEPVKNYSPGDPMADKEGFTRQPNIKPINEMADVREASRSHESNLRAFERILMMLQNTVSLLKG